MHVEESITAYEFLDERLLVLSECPSYSRHIDCFLRALSVGYAPEYKPTTRLAIFSAPRKCVSICCPEVGLAETQPLGLQAWIAFRRLFKHLLVNTSSLRLVVHAAGVTDADGRTALLIGDSGAGKTTLLAALLRQKLRLVCDDYAVIDTESGCLMPLPVGVTVDVPTLNLLPELRQLRRRHCGFVCQATRQWTINLTELYAYVPKCERLNPTHFIFLERDNTKSSKICKTDPDVGVIELLENKVASPRHVATFHPPSQEISARRLAGFCRRTREAHFFRLLNCNLSESVDLVMDSLST
jgi:hypothetical protein